MLRYLRGRTETGIYPEVREKYDSVGNVNRGKEIDINKS